MRVEAAKLLLTIVQEDGRPLEAKFGDLQGQIVQLITYRPIVGVGYDRQARSFRYSVYGLNTSVLAHQWVRYADVQEMKRLYKAFLPDGIPFAVRRFLLEGGVAGASKMDTPRVLDWLARFYLKLSRKPGDYAEVESQKLFNLAAEASAARETNGNL